MDEPLIELSDWTCKTNAFEMSHEKTNNVVSGRSNTNQAVQSQKQARSLTFLI